MQQFCDNRDYSTAQCIVVIQMLSFVVLSLAVIINVRSSGIQTLTSLTLLFLSLLLPCFLLFPSLHSLFVST